VITSTPPGAAVVLRSPQVFRVLAASLAGRLPLGSAPLALLLFGRETMTISMAGVLVGAYTAGTAIGQPLLARMADRWLQPPVMWAAAAVSTAGFAAAVTLRGPVVVTAAAALAGFGAPPFEACLRVLWKDLLNERMLHAAYTLDVTTQELIFIVGPLVTLAAVGITGPTGGLVATALVQIGGTLVFTAAPAVRRWRGESAPRHWAGPLRSSRLRLLLATVLLIGAGVGSTAVAITGYAEAQGSRSWAGWLLAAQATGALTGGLFFARHPPTDLQRSLPRIVGILAVGYLPLLLNSPMAIMAVWLIISGVMLPAVLTGVFITADHVAPPGTAAESFAWVATAFAIGSAAGATMDGALLDATSAVIVGFVPAPLTILAAGTLLRLSRPRRVTAQVVAGSQD
jgi:predicted MFS family arabinose efflux permease